MTDNPSIDHSLQMVGEVFKDEMASRLNQTKMQIAVIPFLAEPPYEINIPLIYLQPLSKRDAYGTSWPLAKNVPREVFTILDIMF